MDQHQLPATPKAMKLVGRVIADKVGGSLQNADSYIVVIDEITDDEYFKIRDGLDAISHLWHISDAMEESIMKLFLPPS